MDRLEAMAMLVEVVERGSLSAAGRSLGVPLPTLSRRIAELEARVGAKLLMRTTRRLVLTDTGAAYLAAARRILDQVREAEREAAGELAAPKGELVVSAPVLFGRRYVLPIVADFLELHPLIDVRLRLSDRNLHLIDDQVDLVVRIGKLAGGTMLATRLGSMRTVVCASPGLLERRGRPKVPADIARLPAVELETPAPSPGWSFASNGAPVTIDVLPRARLAVTTAEAAVDAAQRSVGIVRLLYYQVAEALADGSLEIILAGYELEPAPVHAVHVARSHMPRKLRRFLDFAAPRLRYRLRDLTAGSERPYGPDTGDEAP